MPYQTEYNANPPVAVPGFVKNTEKHNSISRTNSLAMTPFGALVFRSTAADNRCALAGAADAILTAPLGIAIYDNYHPRADAGYPQYETVSILEKGVIYVTVAAAVTRGQPVYFAADGALSAAGTGTALEGATFETSQPTAGGLAAVRLK